MRLLSKAGVGVALMMTTALGGMAAVNAAEQVQVAAATKTAESANPLLAEWTTPFGVPPFSQIEPEHFLPAFEKAMADHKAEVAAITGNPEAPTFENTIVAMEKSGAALDKVAAVFYNLNSSNTNDELQAIARELAPKMAKHGNDISMDPKLFARIDAVYQQRDKLKLKPEEVRLLERHRLDFVRSGAQLPKEKQDRLAQIMERLATLSNQFSQNVLADEKDYMLVLESEKDMEGLPEFVRAAAAQAANERGLDGKHVITLSRSSIEPFLTFSARRDLREKAFKAWIARGDNGDEHDNKEIIKEIVQLRVERANLLGYPTFADYKLEDTMAKTPAAVEELMLKVWEPAKQALAEEQKMLQSAAAAEGQNIEIEPWDWRYYAEKVRKASFDLDQAEIKPYFQLDKMIEAMFYTATRLYGVTFEERKDIPTYHPDVRAFEVKDKDGKHVAVFLSDNFARPSKRSGAWMSSYRSQEKLRGDIRPIVVNNNNFSKGKQGEPALLSFDDANTLFHEFGHGLHGMLSDVTYPGQAGTNVLRDFVELPSQINEHWIEQPEVLKKFAVHYKTGEPIPDELLEKILAAQNFNQGFSTVEYLASSLVDLEFHALTDAKDLDVAQFEKDTLKKIGMPEVMVMRHRSPHFSHIFSGDGYSAGYYSYMWAEVLDADGFEAFKEKGDIFDPELARKLLENVYSAGGTMDPMEAYIRFRGRAPSVEPLLRNRGFLPDEKAKVN
ncbi:M3 family metallopeptidase [Indioceanicola profundi]|uniref:M3 family metallopeptidase n=1 Tax=Indioceanicola profundi TaxID=2220096 RepID=UPI001CEC075B|nr:M3 family metallopeptidase [Indioceanicola profundi]